MSIAFLPTKPTPARCAQARSSSGIVSTVARDGKPSRRRSAASFFARVPSTLW
jgi:hypothetical protein